MSGLPHDSQAESALLASLLLGVDLPDAIEAYMLDADAFFSERYRLVFEACQSLAAENKTVEDITVEARLREQGSFDRAGGLEVIADIMGCCPTKKSLASYVEIVRGYWRRRCVIAAAQYALTAALDETQPVNDALDAAGRVITEARTKIVSDPSESFKVLVPREYKLLQKQAAGEEPENILPSGIEKLDGVIGGFPPGDLVIIGGRTSMGKTSLALQIAIYAAVEFKKQVRFISLEMSKGKLVRRAYAAQSGVALERLRRPHKLQSTDWAPLTKSSNALYTNIVVDDTSQDLNQIRATSRLQQIRTGLDLLVIDYLQLIKSSQREQNREREVADLSRSLKRLAGELGVPVIVLSQVSRACEERTNKRPQLRDLRESGAIEQDADIVIFVYRDFIYSCNNEDSAEIIVAKMRDGAPGIAQVYWNKSCATFCNNEPRQLAMIAGSERI